VAIGYYGTKVSQRMTRTPEGFLVAHRVPIARTGWQDYTPQELGVESSDPILRVYRPDEEVFDRDTMRSFEGKDITDDHPGIAVDPSSWSSYTRGHVQNVHRGTVGESSYDEDLTDRLVADLVIKDGNLINKVEPADGKREVSCGYNYNLHCFDCGRPYNKDGGPDACKCLKPSRFVQKMIRGNHVAVVDSGRAGSSVRIQDTGENVMPETVKPEMVTVPQSFFERLFGSSRYAADAEEKKESKDDMDRRARDARMDKVCDWVEKQMSDDDDRKAKDKRARDKKAKDDDDMQACDAEEGESEQEEEKKEHEAEKTESGDLEPTEITEPSARPFNPIPGADRAAQLAFLNRIKPAVAASGDRTAIDTFNKELRRIRGIPDKAAADGRRSSYGKMSTPKTPTTPDLVIDPQQKIADDYGKMLRELNGKGFAKLSQGSPN
jgi:hypothetical protein